jgi:hypothetical protein
MKRQVNSAKQSIMAIACAIAATGSLPVGAAPLTFTPDLAKNSATLEGLIPASTFSGIKLPKGNIELEDGTLAVTIIPEWNFDRVPVLKGPIIRTEVTTNERQAMVSGVVLFNEGYWYERCWQPGSQDVLVTNSGTITGQISEVTSQALLVTDSKGAALTVPLASLKEIHSPRAYAFAIPAVDGATILPDQPWTADSQRAQLTPTSDRVATASLRRDPLLKGDGDWSTARLVVLGTALSLVELAQFVPELILPLQEKRLMSNALRKEYVTSVNNTLLAPTPANAPPPPGLFGTEGPFTLPRGVGVPLSATGQPIGRL